MSSTINMIVTKAGYKYIGHYRKGYIEIVLEGNCRGVSISPKDEFGLSDLFKCFGINAEDGKWLHELEGKPCRVTFDENGRLKRIQHIVNNSIWWSDNEIERRM